MAEARANRLAATTSAAAVLRGTVLGGTLLGAALLGGCSAPDDAPAKSSPTAQGSPTSATLEEEPGSATPETAARQVLAAWARPDLGYSRWWTDLKPLLSAGAREAYAYTDPAAVPALDLPDEGELTPGPTPGTATVRFETPEGAFGVDLARTRGGKGPWRAERILFPDQPSLYAK